MLIKKLSLAQLSGIEKCQPIATLYNQAYFARDNVIAEAEHTYLKANRLAQRWKNLNEHDCFRVTEIGFGSGLNFLLTCRLWAQKAPKNAQLHYIGVEKHPLTKADLINIHRHFDALPGLVNFIKALQTHYPFLIPGWHDIWLASSHIRLTLFFGEVASALPQCDASCPVQAWYLDGFTPSKAPAMWQSAVFQHMARLSSEHSTFASFTVATELEEGLHAQGFQVSRRPRFDPAYEMSCGHLAHKRPFSSKTPWFVRPGMSATSSLVRQADGTQNRGHALVVGAGLAGAAVAHQLAQKGWQVSVLEAQDKVGSQASGNLAGAVHPLVTADWNLRSQWYLQGFEATLRAVRPWLNSQTASAQAMGSLNGLLQLAVEPAGYKRALQALKALDLPQDFMYAVNSAEATRIAGTTTQTGGVFFPAGGWLAPQAVIQQCLAHPNIAVHLSHSVTGLQRQDNKNGWRVHAQNKTSQAQQGSVPADTQLDAQVVVVATAALDRALNEQLGLPIVPVKGHVSHFCKADYQVPLNVAVTHKGYSVSTPQGVAVSGATFEAPDMSLTCSEAGQQYNIEIAQQGLPEWLKTSSPKPTGRVAFRPTVADHLPVIGPVADPAWVQQAYLGQSHTHVPYRYKQQAYLPGLFVSNGHGARGLMSVFLAAEIISAEVHGEALPQPLALYHATHPARFAIKAWRSGKQSKNK